jgi:hypothetical protein
MEARLNQVNRISSANMRITDYFGRVLPLPRFSGRPPPSIIWIPARSMRERQMLGRERILRSKLLE